MRIFKTLATTSQYPRGQEDGFVFARLAPVPFASDHTPLPFWSVSDLETKFNQQGHRGLRQVLKVDFVAVGVLFARDVFLEGSCDEVEFALQERANGLDLFDLGDQSF